jgi:AraC-like DNA-binding protein
MCKKLFESIETTIRNEQLYAALNLMREDVMKRFGIGRHHLNDLLNTYADGMSFPQYINSIRLEEAVKLINKSPQTPIAVIAKKVGLTAPNFRELFKRKYGITPTEYKEKL